MPGCDAASRASRTDFIHLLVLESQLPHENRQLMVLIRNSKQGVDDFVGELPF